jgi:protein-tyrosine-phosphatase
MKSINMAIIRKNKSSARSVLFVCTGNICRSPLAEYFFRDYVTKKGDGKRFDISSAGTYAFDGNHATLEAIEAGRQWGLDLRSHYARAVNGAIMSSSDYILVMTQAHRNWLLHQHPGYENKIYLTRLFPRHLSGEPKVKTDVPDPIGESVGFYLKVLEMLEPVLPVIYQTALEEGQS